ncbi:MAG TPA: bifunctional demethylmenaquinone methyltransferase/2-methoxy-6-polyprenyl-1,4-benzoquinol methylase UbiE [Acidiferrobacteraceae bacterium]|nr:bifunctional demethylmenaquinone methyltransferase/2-methoxy-6-polyprenyl-1,4-benzoquinol methylase UbiE [Acidiferrobacteraceae bacterium]
MSDQEPVDFGYRQVPAAEKARRVRSVFDSVAGNYDAMNDAMSLGMHRLWKRFAADRCAVRPGHCVLDLAGGTGDMAALLWPALKNNGSLMVADINQAMLERGRARLADRGILGGGLQFIQADAEQLPFADRCFDTISIAFGLRNVTHKQRALESMFRVLRPGGQLVILEFSHARLGPLNALYDAYSLHWLPRLGKILAGDADSYRYLAESIRRHPDQETLLSMMEQAGFERARYFNLSGGIVAVHQGVRL